ncbi:hypothetical protein [Brevundimonas sp.]|uniref:hypothetical protein n=1 Tax=Brevundimonas sp. TaxID=1871086 RepID=UPI0035B20F73
MSASSFPLIVTATWAVTGLGFGLWLYSWFGEKHPVQKLRFQDCGMVLVFSAVLARIALMDRAMTPIDWFLIVISPLFILAALVRLGRTSGKDGDRG